VVRLGKLIVLIKGVTMDKCCDCGSGDQSWWEYDARNIPLCRVCHSCILDKLAKYRVDVLENPNYECNESIEVHQ